MQTQKLTPMCFHIILCTTLVIMSLLCAYIVACAKDGYFSYHEMKTCFEYFFICITETLFLSLAIDAMYKYEKAQNKN